jgi:DNA repair exonuclease SbcCD ATPase subunit
MKTLDFIANLKLNVEGNSTKLDEMIKNLETLKDSSGEIFGVGNETAGKAKQLQERMQEEQKIINDPKATDEAKAAAIKEQNRSMQEYYKLINTVLNREITGLASKSEKAKELLENHKKINEEYQKENQNLDKVIEKMDELSSKTGQYNESVNRLKNEGLLDGVTDTMDAKQIEDKKKELKDTPENKDKRDALEEHLKVVNELKKEGITTEKELADANIKARQEAQTQAEIVDKTRTKKADLLDKVIEQLKAEGKISDETGEILKDTSKILDKEEKITTQKRKRKSIKESKDATGDLGVPKDEGKPKKDTLLQKVTSATLYFAALRALRKMITSVISTVRELDKSITEVAMVTNMNRQQT